jgi:hypothetical protein
MRVEPGHGAKLSDAEYERRIVRLYEGSPASPSAAQRRALHRAQFELMVWHRLGVDFPRDRLETLWKVQRRIERRRAWLIAPALLARFRPGRLERKAGWLARALIADYAKVLSPDELKQFFGPDGVR